jgi:Tfp pilus assembly protein FimV
MPLPALRPTLLGALHPTLALLLGMAPPGVEALGLGRPQVHSVLGKPLDASIPLTLAAGEQLSDSCVRGEVSAGDARVPAGLLQLRIEGEPGQQRIRVQSLVLIDEPALRITLALGCPLRLTREFNAFIDPPASAAVSPAPATAPVPAPQPAAEPGPAPRPLPCQFRQPSRVSGPSRVRAARACCWSGPRCWSPKHRARSRRPVHRR